MDARRQRNTEAGNRAFYLRDGGSALIRALIAAIFWSVCLVVGSLIAFPHALVTGRINFLWAVAMWSAKTGARVAGVKLEVVGREQLDPAQPYIFMSNHTSNIDPPIEVPALGRQLSIMAKKELFKIPIFGTAMRIGNVVPVDRHNRESAIESVRHAVEVLQSGVSMFVYPEGTRSRDGRLLPFKKGPFHMAMESNVPVAPITILHTHDLWPKGKFAIRPGTAKMIFHAPIHPRDFANRDELMRAVRDQIASAMPETDRGPRS